MKNSIIRRLHLWLSIPFGLVITIICLSGSILVFERDFGSMGQYEVCPDGRVPLPIDSLLSVANNSVPEGSAIAGIITYPDSCHAYKFMLTRPAMAALWVDQYTGEVMRPYQRAAIFKFASSAHRRLFGTTKSKTGKLIIGICTLCFVIILITGVILWWPRSAKDVGHKLKIPAGKGKYAFWHGLHCAGGMYITVILLVCALSGLAWSFKWYNQGLYAILGSEQAKSSRHNKPAENYAAWQNVYDYVSEINPSREIRIYQGEAEVLCGGYGNQQAADTYKFDAETGTVTDVIMYDDQPKSRKIKGWLYTLHVGSWCGWWSKILYFIIILIGATLPLTGYYMWIHRINHRH